MRISLRPLLVSIASLTLLCATGCMNRQVYDGLQAGQRNDCLRKGGEREYERCMEHQRMGFEEYERRRESDLLARGSFESRD
jgi:hypothetical protein